MTKEMLLELGITEEQAAKVLEKAAEEQKGFIPRERFNEVNEAKKSLDAQLKERDKQLKDLQSKAGDNEELKKQISDLREQNKAAAKEYQASLHKLSLDNAIDKALTEAHARNNKAVRALLDMEGVDIDEDGKLTGVGKQLKKLAEADDTKFLFDVPKAKEEAPVGKPKTELAGMNAIHTPGGDAAGGQSVGARFAQAYNASVNPQSAGSNS